MKNYKSVQSMNVEAVQFTGNEKELPKGLVRKCRIYQGVIEPFPTDLMGIPKDAFFGVKSGENWTSIQVGDWLVKKEGQEQYVPVADGIFQLFFIASKE